MKARQNGERVDDTKVWLLTLGLNEALCRVGKVLPGLEVPEFRFVEECKR